MSLPYGFPPGFDGPGRLSVIVYALVGALPDRR